MDIGIWLVIAIVVVAVGVIAWALRAGARGREHAQLPGTAPKKRDVGPGAAGFDDLVESPDLRSAVSQLGWEAPTRIQTSLALAIRSGEDVAVEAKRGDGVRAAYLLPMLDRQIGRDGLQSLVVSPDDRGVQEIAGEARTLAQRTELWIGSVRPDAPIDQERRNVRAGFDLLVGTPDRIAAHVRTGDLDLSDVRTVVVAGARSLTEGDGGDLDAIFDALPDGRQVVVVTDRRDDATETLAGRLTTGRIRWLAPGEDKPGQRAGGRTASGATSASPSSGEGVLTGSVRWFNNSKGYGFITPDKSEEDVFVHYSSIEGEGFRSLDAGDRVEFQVEHAAKGPEARHVQRLDATPQ